MKNVVLWLLVKSTKNVEFCFMVYIFFHHANLGPTIHITGNDMMY